VSGYFTVANGPNGTYVVNATDVIGESASAVFQCTACPIVSADTATGTGIATFETNYGVFNSLSAEGSLPSPPTSLLFPHGFFSFTITGFTPGATVTVTINLPTALPSGGFEYWKYHGGLWQPLPPAQATLDSTRKIITLFLTDGASPDDADGLATNGVIVDPGGAAIRPAVVADLEDFTTLPSGNVSMVIGDLAINPHGSKPSGVGYQQGRDTTPLGYLRGMVNNTQPSMFDTNSSVDVNGRPGGAWPLIFTIGGPDINSVSHYYEHTDVAADRAPVTWSEEGSDVVWRFANGTEVVRVTQASTNVPPGTSDVFAIQVLRDADGRLVVLMYGERYTGTWAAAEYFKFIVYPTITTWTDSYYIVRWTDAASGTSANSMPDSGDTFTILAQGTP
jgi:hypothetical protein